MSEMVDRMARAMANKSGAVLTMEIQKNGSPHKVVEIWRDWIPFAEAALAAIREPTETMVDAGDGTITTDNSDTNGRDFFVYVEGDARKSWHAMIDEALK